MSLIKIILTKIDGNFGLDQKEVTLEWLVFSDNLNDFAVSIAQQGQVEKMIVNGEAKGWLAPGKPYQLGSDSWKTAYAGHLDVTDRKIIRGTGNYDIRLNGNSVAMVPLNPKGVAQWKVTETFSEKDKASSEDNENDPFTVRSQIEYEEVPFERDVRTNRLIVNSAGDFFNPPPARKKKVVIYSISRREYGNPISKAKYFSNVVNADNFYGAPPGTVLMESITSDFDGNKWNVTYNFKEDADSFATYLLDTGLNEIKDQKKRPVLNDEGTPATEPVKLNGNGGALSNQNQSGYNLGPFWKYRALPFSMLWLPNPYLIISNTQ